MRRLAAVCGSLLSAVLLALVNAPGASAAASHALITGSGSGWSANAVQQWIADVQSRGLQVVYTAVGSAQGRKDFAYKTTDYAVSDIGYQGTDPVTGDTDTSLGRAYAYLPIVAGGTAFPYHVEVAGKLVRNIRLSGETIAKIFTNQITNWNDPEITRDNHGHALPSTPIIPIVHSEGAGTTAQFTTYLNTVYPSIWRPYFGHPDFTEYYPRKGQQIAQNGSDGVMNYVASSAANGAIGYDEYSYALGKNYPVVKVLNKAGYYTLPTQYNVAVALTQAIINRDKTSKDYLLQDLHNVYSYNDVRVYPLSSYSYGIIPTAPDDPKMTTAKRQTLVDFLSYSICTGQREMGPIGYSPLPVNLVKASFEQVYKLKQADSAVDVTKRDVTTCHNPTFDPRNPSRNYLAEVAPKPLKCDYYKSDPCTGTESIRSTNSGTSNPGSGTSGGGGGGTTGGGTGTSGGTTGASAGGTTGSGAVAGSGPPQINPETGQVIPGTGTATTGAAAGAALVAAVPTDVGHQKALSTGVLAPLAVLLLLAAIVAPPVLAGRMSRDQEPK